MCPTSCDFDLNNLSLKVPDGVLYHIADIDPKLGWNEIGLRRHDKDEKAARELEEAAGEAEGFLQTPEGQKKLNQFLQSSATIFKDLVTKPEGIKRHFPGTKFIFIVGSLRTGGTYLLNEFIRMLDLNRFDYYHRMVGDGIPFLKHSLFWDSPPNYLNWIFQVAQYLQWVKEEWPRQDYVVKKRTCFGHCLPLVDKIFGEQARYYLTMRHPGGIAGSSKDYFDSFCEGDTYADKGWDLLMNDRYGESTEDWDKVSHKERVLKYWKTYYMDVGTTKRLGGKLTPVVFNEDSEEVVREVAEDWDIEHQPEAFEPADREFEDFWDSDKVRETLDKVKKSWEIYDRSWPGVPMI